MAAAKGQGLVEYAILMMLVGLLVTIVMMILSPAVLELFISFVEDLQIAFGLGTSTLPASQMP